MIFEKGDLISNEGRRDIRVIIDIKDESYRFITIKCEKLKDAFGNDIVFEKGSESEQPCYIVDKYFYLLEL